jgi:elongation factor Ts
MAQISASLVKELREMTGLAMMECKKALTEAGGDIKKAEQLLRIKSGARASKAAGRIAAEGAIGTYVSPDGKTGALVELNCETDFVAKNDDFLSFAQFIAEAAATRNPKDISQLAAGKIEERRQQLVQKIGENIAIRRFRRLQAAGKIALYIHGAKIGVLVDYEGPEEVGKDMGMHIAFARPRHLSKTEVPLEVINEERKIQEARARESGKPPEIAAKMVEGSLNKFLAEMSLMGQPFVKDDKQTVEKMLAARKAKINGFAFLVVGEGISKEKELH